MIALKDMAEISSNLGVGVTAVKHAAEQGEHSFIHRLSVMKHDVALLHSKATEAVAEGAHKLEDFTDSVSDGLRDGVQSMSKERPQSPRLESIESFAQASVANQPRGDRLEVAGPISAQRPAN
jgi:hypothetical protein